MNGDPRDLPPAPQPPTFPPVGGRTLTDYLAIYEGTFAEVGLRAHWYELVGINAAGGASAPGPVSITQAMLVKPSVGTPELFDFAVSTSKLADSSVTDAKILSLSYGKLIGAPSALPPSGPAGGDLTGNYPNPLIGPNAVGDPEISSVTGFKVLDGTLPLAKLTATDLKRIPPLPNLPIDYGRVLTVDPGTGFQVWLPIAASGGGGGGSPTGPAGGDLTGTYPNPAVAPGAITRAKTATDLWLPPVPTAGDVGKLLTVVTGPALQWAPAAGGSLWSDDLVNGFLKPTDFWGHGVLLASGRGIQWGDPTTGNVGRLTGIKADNNSLRLWTGSNGLLVFTADQSATLYSVNAATGMLGIGPSYAVLPTRERLEVEGGVLLGAALGTADGIIQWAGGHFQGRVSGVWVQLDNAASSPPSGPAGGDLAGTYPNPTLAPGAVSDADISDVAWSKITGVPASFPPTGPAGGDLTGTYPNPTVGPGAVGNAEISDVAWSKVTGAPTSFPPSGAAGGDLLGSTYPNPVIKALAITNAKVNDVAWGKITGAPAFLTAPVADASIASVSWSKITGAPAFLTAPVTRSQLGVNAAVGSPVYVAIPTSRSYAPGTVWTTLASLSITTRGGWVFLFASSCLSAVCASGSGNASVRWLCDGSRQCTQSNHVISAGTTSGYSAIPGFIYLDPPAAGAHTYALQVNCEAGITMITSGIGGGGICAVEVG